MICSDSLLMDNINESLSRLQQDGSTARSRMETIQRLRASIDEIEVGNEMYTDKWVSQVLTTSYAFIRAEKRLYSTSKQNTRETCSRRLMQYGHIIRELFTKFLTIIRPKTAKAFVEHAIDILPTVQDILLASLSIPYLRVLQMILDHSVFLDHFNHALWSACSDFCISSIETLEEINEAELHESNNSYASHRRNSVRPEVVSLTSCLAMLCSWNSANLTAVCSVNCLTSERLCHFVDNYFQCRIDETSAHVNVLVILQKLLRFTSSNDIELARTLAKRSLVCCQRYWDSRNASIRQPLLGCLVLSCPFLDEFAHDKHMSLRIEPLIRLIISDLIRRTDRISNLQLTHLVFDANESRVCRDGDMFGATTPILTLNASTDLIEATYLSIQILVHLLVLKCSSPLQSPVHSPSPLDDSPRRKRRRVVIQESSSLSELLAEKDPRFVALGLQIATFGLELGLQSYLDEKTISMICNLQDSEISLLRNWAMVCLASSLRLYKASSGEAKAVPSWINITTFWPAVIRGVATSDTSRSACHLAIELLDVGWISTATMSIYATQLAQSILTVGPANLSDAACRFLMRVSMTLTASNFWSKDQALAVVTEWCINQCVSSASTDLKDMDLRSLQAFLAWIGTDDPSSSLSICDYTRSNGLFFQLTGDIRADDIVRQFLLHDRFSAKFMDLNHKSSVPQHSCKRNPAYSRQTFSAETYASIFSVILHWGKSILLALKTEQPKEQLYWQAFCCVISYFRLSLIQPQIRLDDGGVFLHLSETIIAMSPTMRVTDKDCALLTWSLHHALRDVLDKSARHDKLRYDAIILKIFKTLLTHSFPQLITKPDANLKELMRDTGFSVDRALSCDSASMAFEALPSSSFVDLLFLLTNLIDAMEGNFGAESQFSKYFLDKSSRALVRCTEIWFFWDVIFHPQRLDLSLIFDYIGKGPLQDYSFERADVLLMFVARTLSHTVHDWVGASQINARNEMGRRLYAWLKNMVLKSRYGSHMVRIEVISLCRSIIYVDASCKPDGKMSTRSDLISHLSDPDLRVAFAAGIHAMSLFEKHELSVHQGIFNDILAALPALSEHQANLKLRVFVLTLMSIKSEIPRLLALYELLDMTLYAYLANILHASILVITELTQHTLLSLWRWSSCCMIWSWLNRHSFQLFPFTLFGFTTQREFLQSSASEVASQLICRGHLDQFAELCHLLDTPESVLLKEYAGKIKVYGMIQASKGQVFEPTRFMERMLGTESLTTILASHDLFSIAFSLMYDTEDAARVLRAFSYFDIASKAENILPELGSAHRPAEEHPLVCSIEVVMRLFEEQPLPDGLPDRSSLMRTAQRLLMGLSSTASIDIAQSLRKLGLLLCFNHNDSSSNYLSEMLLRGLTIFIVARARNDLENVVCCLMLHIIRVYRPDTASGSNVLFISLISILSIEKYLDRSHGLRTKLMQVIASHSLALVPSSISDMLELLENCHHIEPCSTRLLKVLECAAQWLNVENTPYVLTGKRLFLQLIAPMVKNTLLQSPAVVLALQRLIGANYEPSTDIDAELVIRVAGASYLLQTRHPSIPPSERVNTDQSTESSRWVIRQELLFSLQSVDSSIIRCAEITISKLYKFCRNKIDFPDQLTPFLDPLCKSSSWPNMTHEELLQNVLDAADYASWLRNFLQILLFYQSDRDLYCQMQDLCALDTQFSSKIIFQLIVQGMAVNSCTQDRVVDIISEVLHHTFCNHVISGRQKVATAVTIAAQLRFTLASTPAEFTDSPIAEIDYLEAARAASFHGLQREAALLIHVAWSGIEQGKSTSVNAFQSVVCRAMGEPDAISGLPGEATLYSTFILSSTELNTSGTLAMFSAMQSAKRRDDDSKDAVLDSKISTSLRDLGLDIINLQLRGNTFDDAKYQSAWRLGQWNLPYTPNSSGRHQTLYRALCSTSTMLSRKDRQDFDCCRNAFLELTTSLENLQEDMPVIGSLLELEEAVLIEQHQIPKLISNIWLPRTKKMRELLNFNEYEPLVSARQIILDLMQSRRIGAIHALQNEQMNLLVLDHKDLEGSGAHPSALTAAAVAERFLTSPDSPEIGSTRLLLQSFIAEVLWKSGEHLISIELLHKAIEMGKRSSTESLLAASNMLDLGLRLSSGRLQKPSKILHEYLTPALDAVGSTHSEEAGAIHLKFALFCDEQLESFTTSEDFMRLERLRNEKSREINALDSLIGRSTTSEDKRRLQAQKVKATALFEIDDSEYSELDSSRQMYLRKSLKSFLAGLSMTDTYDVLISRCLTLWFANNKSDLINSLFGQDSDAVPSRKFLVVLDQLLARLDANEDAFQKALSAILTRLVEGHPYQSLYVMYAVQHSRRSGDFAARGRVKAITKIVQGLSARRTMEIRVANVRCVCSNYVKLAETNIDKKAFSSKSVPFSVVPNHRAFLVDFAKLRVPPLTLHLPPRPSCDYSDIPTIDTYEKKFTLASGISHPKVINCKVSDGTTCKELVKGGNDDLRQDGVMQRVFTQVDDLFQRHRPAAKRNMKIRTYKVLPLATNAGVLEWVRETTPLQDLLQPLHEKYNSGDWSYAVCRKAIADVAKKTRGRRIDAFNQIMLNCRPAMRHAFIELCSNPSQWYEAQLAYTRSTAAISIVGHVLGLGDRHLHNILIDKSNGEVVHIDLGIAFDQGKTLPIPELVPFRLTRDTIDGMGIMGVEGVFRRGCEITLEVMRSEKASIRSILDVLRQDPLYIWTLSPLRKLAMQEREAELTTTSNNRSGIPEEIGTEAARALLIVEKKLSASLSTSAVVSELIQQATDPENLALIFAGWSAWY